jgi:ribosomal protein S13
LGIDKTRKIETISEDELDKIREEVKSFLVE